MLRAILLVTALGTLPSGLLAGGANVKKGGEARSACAAGFFYDKAQNLCVAANWR